MEIKVKYSGLADRQVKVEQYEAQKKPRDFDIIGVARDTRLRMLHDNFDNPKWKHGDPMKGTMTFTDEPEQPAIVEPTRDLAAEFDNLKAKLKEKGIL